MKQISLILALACSVMAAEDYRLLKKYPLPGEEGVNYLSQDAPLNRLYVARDTQMQALDFKTGKLVGSIPAKGAGKMTPLHRPSAGLCAIPGSSFEAHGTIGCAYFINERTDSVTAFDLETLAVIGETATGKKPNAITHDSPNARVFVNNAGSKTTTVINSNNGKVVGTVDLGGTPGATNGDGKGSIYTLLEKESEMVKVDAAQMKVVARWKLAPCEQPVVMSLDRAKRRIFVGCRNHLMALVDIDTGKVLQTLPIGDKVNAAAFDSFLGMVFFSNGDGTLNVFHEESANALRAVQTVKTQVGVKNITVDDYSHQVFLSAAEPGPTAGGKKSSAKPRTFNMLVVGCPSCPPRPPIGAGAAKKAPVKPK